ncbi:hypothetical protein CROQUDRAFT_60737 [Cronartium quercuum f. sp. fusiforme G11]|uniref:alpha-1,2-Mannosidase n=1 Tax=Cronartium quercuum f. sp. fusiforme G11 TaxID=708437 RepID=A0A9P6NQB0_9BASI|nr:hypothetical protein CROQUDRAFT_60737 [Cronartium quercuum f. sp. fusiforme G11]
MAKSNPPSPSRIKNVILAFFFSISTVTFYSVICVLLSYAVLDFISPHPGISFAQNKEDLSDFQIVRDEAQATFFAPLGDANFQSKGGRVPNSEIPWDPSTNKGARALQLLSKRRFPLIRSPDLPMGWQGMTPPPNLTWPSPSAIQAHAGNVSKPLQGGQLYGHPSGTDGGSTAYPWSSLPRHTWDPASANFTSTSLRRIQWQGFQDRTLWDTAHMMVVTRERQEWVTRAFSHAWEGYKKYAWGFDEVKPLTNRGVNTFAGWGATIMQCLDTLLIMNMTREYNYARTHVRAVDWSSAVTVAVTADTKHAVRSSPPLNILELVVRYLGALLSAYDLSGDPLMLSKAEELATWILPAFGTQTGIPMENYVIGSNPVGSPTGPTHLAAAYGFILEFTRLSQVTRKDYYINIAQRASEFLSSDKFDSTTRLGTLLPNKLDPENTRNLAGVYNLGHQSKTYYEYLLKQQMLLISNTPGAYDSFALAVDSMHQFLSQKIQLQPNSEALTIFGEQDNTGGQPVYKPSLSQESCSSAAFIGLGSRVLGRQKDLDNALQVSDTCLWAYDANPTGLASEALLLDPSQSDRWGQVESENTTSNSLAGKPMPGVKIEKPQFFAGPNTIEAVFYMWRLTGERRWQDKGWEMFTSWVQECITDTGFAELENASYLSEAALNDSQGAYVLAETFKYYYLLFSDPNYISLDEYVFNTASHPFRMPINSSTAKSLWEGPQEAIDSEFNPPPENQLKSHQTLNLGNNGSWGTALQQWSWTGK